MHPADQLHASFALINLAVLSAQGEEMVKAAGGAPRFDDQSDLGVGMLASESAPVYTSPNAPLPTVGDYASHLGQQARTGINNTVGSLAGRASTLNELIRNNYLQPGMEGLREGFGDVAHAVTAPIRWGADLYNTGADFLGNVSGFNEFQDANRMEQQLQHMQKAKVLSDALAASTPASVGGDPGVGGSDGGAPRISDPGALTDNARLLGNLGAGGLGLGLGGLAGAGLMAALQGRARDDDERRKHRRNMMLAALGLGIPAAVLAGKYGGGLLQNPAIASKLNSAADTLGGPLTALRGFGGKIRDLFANPDAGPVRPGFTEPAKQPRISEQVEGYQPDAGAEPGMNLAPLRPDTARMGRSLSQDEKADIYRQAEGGETDVPWLPWVASN